MFRLHISGAIALGAARRCSSVMIADPPVVMLMMPSHPALIAGRNPAQCAGSEDGWPVSGWRACRCRIAAPASAAPIALAVICAAVTGREGDMLGVWGGPAVAQEMKIFDIGSHRSGGDWHGTARAARG